ncbi:chromate efflux transporter [Desulfovibrio sp. TomC]|uniref:chromate efflux transporter n=1 Tax=Desulfovibrio sp. TomC TaxID=1562888 RepID=UPI00057562E0|nr:chromate efflux transporter [Desulfovibrio sp. TomC]KHK01792.1 Chromate transport protein ChrA [Desulfovibrio sp. TomC]
MDEKWKASGVSLKEAFHYWFKLGFINFGGPAGQIAMMHKNLVDSRGWIDEKTFLRALNFCMLLPGPEAHQLAVYIGWRLNGYAGGAIAGLCFLLPSVVLMLFLSWLAVAKGHIPAVSGIFHGIAAAVVAIVIEALIRLSKKSLKHPALYAFAGGSFLLGQFGGVSFPLIVLLAGIAGVILGRFRPDIFCHTMGGSKECVLDEPTTFVGLPHITHVFRIVGLFILIWSAVVLPVIVWRGLPDILSQISLFFSKAPFVTFGGAYAVLAYIVEHAVRLNWLTEKDMLLGLGLAETTPGPLIMVTQFVGFITAWNQPGNLTPIIAGILGGLLTTFTTFLPSFMFIFAGAPYIEAITSNPKLNAALTGISGAVVGVVLKLGVFFALSTFFPASGIDFFAVLVACAALFALVRWKLSMHALVGLSGAAGLIWQLIG